MALRLRYRSVALLAGAGRHVVVTSGLTRADHLAPTFNAAGSSRQSSVGRTHPGGNQWEGSISREGAKKCKAELAFR
jgi:hypothetical protein